MEIKDLKLATDASILAYYRFSAGALTTDSSGNNITLTNNGTVGSSTAGKFSGCADFGSSNTSKYFSYADDFGRNGQTVSISLWFKKTNASDNCEFFFLSDSTTNTQLYGYSPDGSTISVQRYRTGVAYETITKTTTMDTNWHHFCVTMSNSGSGGPMILYYDGINVGNTTVAGTSGNVPQGDNFYIGLGPGNYTKGYIDDVAVYARVLSFDEVSSIYNAGPSMMGDF